ncbi:putative uncharacterized protein DDB_G0277255 [Stomoxys calcitrans]|uniref:Uncharacterized protein n=1 Tax=Stomoxys calcitrans TaxID=35570 RepID=A0A1I8PS08_STOCA|nr:putative uncharacterized protein DDB_G0277255 [Stomoxys calcitrans]XP_059224165.1 putative uncharacterized protein DDB_G0277255 [Stomoxys calcitrans]XP_059224166.1 putative uncharacterized protein DDB_G0277255 [Stomoxys calcitrans]
MGQEISQHNKCYTSRRQQQQSFPQQSHHHYSDKPNKNYQPTNNTNPYSNNTNNSLYTTTTTTSTNSCSSAVPNVKHYNAKHKELVYTSSSISNASSTDDEYYRQRQKYSLTKQSYEKSKVAKPLGSRKSLDSHSTTTTTSDYQSCNFAAADELYRDIKGRHQRHNSQSTDSGIYYSSCQCTPTRFSSTASVASGGGHSVVSSKSNKSVQKQKDYLDHHLYIKSYLDILEEDQRASAQYKVAKPGGIRNYKPKILAEVSLSTSAPVTTSTISAFSKHKSKLKEDPWI